MTGFPERYAVTGFPVAQSLSPRIHALFAQQTGHAIEYGLLEVEPARFETAVGEFFAGGGRGLNVTMPHKLAAFRLAPEVSARARIAGAVNWLGLAPDETLLGDNTDGAGLLQDLVGNLSLDLSDRRILVIGAGGATRGILAQLFAAAPAQVHVANRTPARAQALAVEFAGFGSLHSSGLADVPAGGFDLVINAAPAGADDAVPQVPVACVQDADCYDLNYRRTGSTPFQRWSAANGARSAHAGLGMLVEQAAESFFLWRGVRPDTSPVLAALATNQANDPSMDLAKGPAKESASEPTDDQPPDSAR